jgi:hypothetical protein
MPPAATEIAHIPTSSKGEGEIHIASFNCKNLKTSAYIIEELLKQHQIILVQEHWIEILTNSSCLSICSKTMFVILSCTVLPISCC